MENIYSQKYGGHKIYILKNMMVIKQYEYIEHFLCTVLKDGMKHMLDFDCERAPPSEFRSSCFIIMPIPQCNRMNRTSSYPILGQEFVPGIRSMQTLCCIRTNAQWYTRRSFVSERRSAFAQRSQSTTIFASLLPWEILIYFKLTDESGDCACVTIVYMTYIHDVICLNISHFLLQVLYDLEMNKK